MGHSMRLSHLSFFSSQLPAPFSFSSFVPHGIVKEASAMWLFLRKLDCCCLFVVIEKRAL